MTIKQFTAPSGNTLVYLTSFPDGDQLLFSPGEALFFALFCYEQTGHDDAHVLMVEDPHHGTVGPLVFDHGVIEYDGERFVQTDVSFVVPLPVRRIADTLCQDDSGTFYYLSRDAYQSSYAHYKLFIGNGRTMGECHDVSIVRYDRHVGGTVAAASSEGTLLIPQRLFADSAVNAPIWRQPDNQPRVLDRLDPDNYDIVETPAGQVTITRR